MKRTTLYFAALVLGITLNISVMGAVSIDSLLTTQINASPLLQTPVIITFDHQPTSADFTMLRSLGILGGQQG